MPEGRSLCETGECLAQDAGTPSSGAEGTSNSGSSRAYNSGRGEDQAADIVLTLMPVERIPKLLAEIKWLRWLKSLRAGRGLARVGRVVNSKMGHAATRAVERAGFVSEKEARIALKKFGDAIVKNGLPAGTVRDAAGHLVVPGFGEGGAVVYRQAGEKLTLQTVVNWIEGMGTPIH